MNRLEDSDLREALRRREARRTKPEVPADFMDSVMQQIEEKPAVGRCWRWIAAAASLLLLIGIGAALLTDKVQQFPSLVEKECPKGGVGAAISTPTEVVAETRQKEGLQTPPPTPLLEGRGAAAPTQQSVQRKGMAARPQYSSLKEDTLGSSIWQSERNVERALQMLSECEAVIEKSEQEVRNDIVRATFNAVPQPANAVLVTNEAGDYYVSDTNEQTVIEL